MKSLNQSSQELQLSSPQKSKYAFNPIQELDLKTSKSNRQDYLQLTNILTNILPYPSNQLAELHMESDRLGRYDMAEQVKTRTQGNTKGEQARDNLEHCPCCGFIRQTQQLKVCSQLESINNIGVSTYLYYKTIKNLVILLIIMTILYSLYAFITNAVASEVYSQIIDTDVATNLNSVSGYVAVSLGSKQLNPTQINKSYYYAQCWIGFVMIIVWSLSFFAIRYYEAFQQVKIEDQNISAADFTISIQHMPKDVTKQELQAQFNKYFQTLGNVPQKLKEELKIAKINVGTPFYLNKQDYKDKELQQLKKRKKQLIQIFIGWIKERQRNSSFSLNKQERSKIYEEYQELLKKEQNKYKQIQQKIKENMKLKATKQTTTVFVTFEHSKSMRLVTGLNDPSIAAIIRYYLTCCIGHNRFNFYRGEHNYNVKIEKAPEPQDIAWNNLAVPLQQRIKKKAVTFSVTFVLLGISFAIVYGLSQAQQNAQDNNALSFVISIFISVIGIVLEVVIKKLSQLERDSTIIKYQISVAIKSIVAQLFNSILIPMLVNIYIKEDVYGQNGLASDVFMIGLTSSFITPLLKIFNFGHIINRLYKFYVSRTNNRLGMDQNELNEAFSYVQFEIGSQYVEIVSLYLFVCFFVSLQPIISLFAICGFILMYWVQKYNMFNRMRRPVPGTNLINNTMFQIIISGGIMFSLGSLTWSNFMDGGIPKAALIPNLFTLFASIIMFLMPYRAIISLFIKQSIAKQMKFSEKRIALSSQYDRLNPVTSADALKEFQQYFNRKFDNANQQEKNKLSQEIIKNLNKGHHKPVAYAHPNIMANFFQSGLAFLPPPPQIFMINASTRNGTRSQFGLQNQNLQSILKVPGLQQPNFKPLVISPTKPQNTIRGNYPYNQLPGISPLPSNNNLSPPRMGGYYSPSVIHPF